MAKQKHLMEYRYYEIPAGHYVLALLGEVWERNYGADMKDLLHFHNYMEIGYCYWGSGTLVIEDSMLTYKGGINTIIPENVPHTTESVEGGLCKWEYLFVDIEGFIRHEMRVKGLMPEEIIKRINKQSYCLQWNQNKMLTSIIRSILEEYREKSNYYKETVKGYLRSLVVELLRINEDMSSSITLEEKKLNSYIEKSVDFISKNYKDEIKMSDVSDECGLSESHFRRIFEETMGMKPLDYLNMIRIDKACELISNEDIAMEEVGFRVGYQTPSTFNRNFKKLTGKTPYQWKQEEKHMVGTKKNYKISAKKGW